jgi:nicotinate-nucleotide pyrophosphorylase (carboxylating)
MIRHRQILKLKPEFVEKKLQEFFNEDNIEEDITTKAMQDCSKKVEGYFIAKEDMIFVGNEIIKQGFKECSISKIKEDGENLKKGETIAIINGPTDVVLKKERVVLNLLQRLSGVATTTHKLVKKLQKKNIQLLDTRKTTPGLREFEKFAVCVGGGTNHRFSLKEAVVIKDNHLIGNPNLKDVVEKAEKQNPGKDIEVEVDTIIQLKEALETKATSILLDNFSPKVLPKTVQHIRSHKNGSSIYIEVSGGINSNNLDEYCIKGIDGISMGALTHNIKSKDISLDLK